MKFTFKKQEITGRYSSFYKRTTDIKLLRKVCGSLDENEDRKWRIRFMVMKTEEITDNNPNCPWKWITLSIRFDTEDGAREWLNIKADYICERYTLHFSK